jgi:hypothetical protein
MERHSARRFHHKIMSSILNGVSCTLRKYTCSGIKACSKTSPEFCHDEVTDSASILETGYPKLKKRGRIFGDNTTIYPFVPYKLRPVFGSGAGNCSTCATCLRHGDVE